MRFLEFVPCGRPAAAEPQTPQSSAEGTAAAEKRRGRRSTAIGSAAHWRPSLGSISEDRVASAATAAVAGRKSGGTGKAKAAKKGRVIPPSVRDDYRDTGIPVMVPAFAPTAFLF